MTPTYGNCRECSAWEDQSRHLPKVCCGACRRHPQAIATGGGDGCWSFIPKLAKDAYAETLGELTKERA